MISHTPCSIRVTYLYSSHCHLAVFSLGPLQRTCFLCLLSSLLRHLLCSARFSLVSLFKTPKLPHPSEALCLSAWNSFSPLYKAATITVITVRKAEVFCLRSQEMEILAPGSFSSRVYSLPTWLGYKSSGSVT